MSRPVRVFLRHHLREATCRDGWASILKFPSSVMGRKASRVRHRSKGQPGSAYNDERCLGGARDNNAGRGGKCRHAVVCPAIRF